MGAIKSIMQYSDFQSIIRTFYAQNRRDFPWRCTYDPYHIVISEIMLQQTQTDRVVPKFEKFIQTLPTIGDCARAEQREVITLWQGLGYNRRAKMLHEMAKKVIEEHAGKVPADPKILATLPGIGKATAGAICAYAFNMPVVFIETNVRAVFIHHFFEGRHEVHDQEIVPHVAATVDHDNPREWYYALMDYGVHLKKLHKNPARRSAHHARQSKFEGSERQIRGMILRLLTQHPALTREMLCGLIDREPQRVEKNLEELMREGLIRSREQYYFL